MTNILIGFLQQLTGKGHVPQPDAGNLNNPPGHPPVQFGSYEWIQPFNISRAGNASALTRVGQIAPAWRNWGQFGVGATDIGGFLGGGPALPEGLPSESLMWFDPQTGLYYNLGNTS